jgi:hypothetical protein
MFAEEHFRISERFKDALVADYVVEDGDDLKEARRDLKDERDWTWHLGRQLGFTDTYGPGGIHHTLMQVIYELEPLLRNWPLPADGRDCNDIANSATKSLTPVEVYATLTAGPKTWRKDDVPAKFSDLDSYFRTALRKGLAAALRALFLRWNEWDVPRLNVRSQEAQARRHAAAVTAKKATLTPQEQLQARRDRQKWRDGASYRPPGRTT